MKYTHQVLDLLAKESSINKKISILEEAKKSKVYDIEDVLFLTYDPFTQFGIKKIPEFKPNNSRETVSLTQALKRLKRDLLDKKIRGNRAKDTVRLLLESVSLEDADVIRRILNRNLEVGVSAKTINKVWPNLIPIFGVMNCHNTIEHIDYPAYLQEKVDGARVFLVNKKAGNYDLFSKNGKRIEDHDWFKPLSKLLPDNCVLDGELLVLDKKGKPLSRKKGNGIVNKGIQETISVDETQKFQLVVWDMLTVYEFENGSTRTTKQRHETLINQFYTIFSFDNVNLVPCIVINSQKEALDWFNEYTKNGSEGVIVKNFSQVWEPGKRVKGWGKLKLENEMELQIKGVIEGLGKHQGKLGSLKCEDSSGKLSVNIGGGFSDTDREKLWEDRNSIIDKIITVRYNEILVDEEAGSASLFLARYVESRFDKDKADDVNDLLKNV